MRRAQPEGEPAAVFVPTDSLRAWAKNPRQISAKHVEDTRRSIERFGFAAPIVARPDGEIIAGHTRWAAAKALGMPAVPVRFVDLPADEAHLLAVADNRLTDLGEWDDAALAEFLGPLMMLHDDAAAVAGFSDDDIEKLLRANGDAVIEAADDFARAQTGFVVLVDCRDEAHQRELIDRFLDEGLTCRALT